MSAVRPILRPARWEEDEPSRPPSPRPPPPLQAQPSATYHSAPPLHPQPPPQSYYRSSPRSDQRRIHYLEDPPQEWPVKRKKYFGVPAVYYPPDLNPSELLWRDRYTSLYQRGYQLRPRYQPTWTPTRLGNGRHHHSGEDHIMQILPQVLDAIRRQDGLVVCLKMIQEPKKAQQMGIIEYLTSRRMSEDSRNHVVPVYDAFSDKQDPRVQFLVMPVLRKFDDPAFLFVGEVMDFVTQVVEGLAFLHENNVAHHNIAAEHLMMDARKIVPTGWHFVAHFCEPDGLTKIGPLERRFNPVRYYYVGFGNALHINPKEPSLHLGSGGLDDDAPELFQAKPYDPFKYDVYTLGNVLKKHLYQKYSNIEFLSGLLSEMHIQAFENRPGASRISEIWKSVRRGLDEDELDETRLIDRSIVVPSRSENRSVDSSSSDARSGKRDISSILNEEPASKE